MITFTGSPEVGWGIRGRAARKKVGLELGNNAPVIIEARQRLADGGREDQGRRASPTPVRAASRRNGSWPSDAIHDEFLDRLVKEVSSLAVGDPLDEGTDVSALISAEGSGSGQGVDRRGGRRRARRSCSAARSTTRACWHRRSSTASRLT